MDQYAQELRRLFYKAYPRENQGSGEAEGFGRSVLAHLFVAGLLPVLRSKVAGNEGNLDQLLIKARFEEAKIRDLASTSEGIPSGGILRHQGLSPNNRFSASNRMPRQDTMDRCYICNQPGHFARNCSLKGRGAPPVSRGRTMPRGETTAANLNEEPASLPNVQDEIAELRRKLQLAEVHEALAKVSATNHALHKDAAELDQKDNPTLGPTLTAEIFLEGWPTQALLDTESPVSIVSMDFLIRTLVDVNKETVSKEERVKCAESKLRSPTIKIRNLGGGTVNVLSQATVSLRRGDYQCEATVLVQKGSALEFLLGTDLLAMLGGTDQARWEKN